MNLQYRSIHTENHPPARNFLNDHFVPHPGQFAFFLPPLTKVNSLWNGGASVHRCTHIMGILLGLQNGVESRKDDRGDQNNLQPNRQRFFRGGLFLFKLFLLLSSLLIVPARAATDCAVPMDTPQIECEALLALYNSTNGASWTNNSGWNANNQPCFWQGIVCSGGRVISINLSSNNLSGTLPNQLGSLSALQTFILYDNQLSGPLPAKWSALSTLQSLILSFNRLSGTLPVEWSRLSALQSLDLSFNQLSGLLPVEWSTLSALQSLNLSANQLSGPLPPRWGNLNALRFFGLSVNQLSGDIPFDFTHLTQLKDFSIEYNMLTADPTVTAFVNQYRPDWQHYQTIPPNNLVVTTITHDKIQLNWSPILYQTDSGYYEVGYSDHAGGPYIIERVNGDKTAFTHTVTNLLSGTPYYFVVRTYTSASSDSFLKNTWTSGWSAEIQGIPNITEKPTLTANVPTLTRPYGTPNPTLLPTYTGWIGSIETIDIPPTITTSATETSPPGTYPITCSEGQDNNYLIVCGPPGTLTITPLTTTTLAQSTPNPSVSGTEVTFTFTVQSPDSTTSIPKGEVKILQGTTPICQAPLTNGLGVCTAPLNGIGPQTFTATYLGDVGFQESTSKEISHFLLQAGYASDPVPGETINFGSGPLNMPMTTSLMIKETGNQTLQVTLQGLTGDPDFKILTSFPINIANGNSESAITLACTPTSLGPHMATLELSTNDLAQSTVSYPLTCEGQAPPGYESSSSVNSILEIGNSQVGQSVTFPLNVKEVGTGDLQVNFAELTGPHAKDFQVISPTFPFTLKDEAGTIQTIDIRCTPSDLGKREARLTLTSNDPQYPTPTYLLECQGTAIPTSGYNSLPNQSNFLNFGISPLGQAITFKLELMETGNLPLTIALKGISGPQAQDFSLLSPLFPLTLPDGAPPQAVILRCVPSALGLRMAELTFTSNDPQHPLITYALQCIGQEEVAYHSEPPPDRSINFGSLLLGKTQIMSLSVNKIGKGTLDIVKGELTGSSYFSLLSWKLPISLQDTAQSLFLQCLPQEFGKHQATLVVTLSDLSKISYSLLCYGLSGSMEITKINLSNQIIAAHTRPEEVIGNFHSEATGIAEPHFLYRLIEDAQGTFKVLEDQLILAKPLAFEQAAIYQIIVKSMEENSGVEKNASFVIEVNAENHAPTEIQLSHALVGERSQGLVGKLTTIDPDVTDTHTYSLSSGGQFVLENGNEVHVAPGIVFKKQSSYLIRVTSTDAEELSISQEFPIEIQAEARFAGEIRDEAGKIRKNDKIDEPERVTLIGRIQPSAFHVGQLADLMFFYHWTPSNGGRALEGSSVFAHQTRLEENMAEKKFFQGKLLGLAGVFNIELGYRIGEEVWSEPVFALEVLPNRPPTKLELEMKPILEKRPENTLIGTLTMEDPDRSEHFSYKVVDDKWRGYLTIKGNQLLTGPWFLRWGQSYAVTIRGMDLSGASLEKTFKLEVLKDDTMGELRLTHAQVFEGSAAGTPIGRLFILGEKEGNGYRLLKDAQGRFALRGDILVVKAKEGLDFEMQSHHEIVVEVMRGSQQREKTFSIEVLDVPEKNSSDE